MPATLKVAAVVVTVPIPTRCAVPSTNRLFVSTVRFLLAATVSAPFMVVVPPAAPTLRVVAAPAKLMVVAAVLSKSKLAEAVVRLVVIAGLVPKTATPVPVSSLRPLSKAALVPVDTKFLEPSVKTAWEAVRLAEVIVPALLTLKLGAAIRLVKVPVKLIPFVKVPAVLVSCKPVLVVALALLLTTARPLVVVPAAVLLVRIALVVVPALLVFTCNASAAPVWLIMRAVAAVPLVPLTVRATTLLTVGVMVSVAVAPGTCTRTPVPPQLPQLGAVLTPPDIKQEPVAISASLLSAVVVLAYNRSPTA